MSIIFDSVPSSATGQPEEQLANAVTAAQAINNIQPSSAAALSGI